MKYLLLLSGLLLCLICGCVFISDAPTDKQIISDYGYQPSDNWELVYLKVKGFSAEGNYGKAFIDGKERCTKTYKAEELRPLDPSLKPAYVEHKAGEENTLSDTLYYIKTNKGWMKISAGEYLGYKMMDNPVKY